VWTLSSMLNSWGTTFNLKVFIHNTFFAWNTFPLTYPLLWLPSACSSVPISSLLCLGGSYEPPCRYHRTVCDQLCLIKLWDPARQGLCLTHLCISMA
jgi:hypothetical protein